MTPNANEELQLLRAQIAAAAARLIAEDGHDYHSALRKAARRILGEAPAPNQALPDHAQIEAELRAYQALFQADAQPARLFQLRTLALSIMDHLAAFSPYLTGAVLHGTAGQYDDIHLQLFADSAKDVEIFLLNRNIQIELSETPHFKGPRFGMVETVSFLWHREGVHAVLYERDDLRGAGKTRADGRMLRADRKAVRALLELSAPLSASLSASNNGSSHPPPSPTSH